MAATWNGRAIPTRLGTIEFATIPAVELDEATRVTYAIPVDGRDDPKIQDLLAVQVRMRGVPYLITLLERADNFSKPDWIEMWAVAQAESIRTATRLDREDPLCPSKQT